MLFADTSVQTAFDHALWQYPVAGLLVLVVILFLRYLAKAEQRNQEDRRHIQVTFTDALEREREEMWSPRPSRKQTGKHQPDVCPDRYRSVQGTTRDANPTDRGALQVRRPRVGMADREQRVRQQAAEIEALRDQGMSDDDVAEKLGIHVATLYRRLQYKREMTDTSATKVKSDSLPNFHRPGS